VSKYFKSLLVIVLVINSINLFGQVSAKRVGDKVKSNTISLYTGPNYYFGDVEKGGVFSKNAKNQINYFVQGNLHIGLWDYFTLRVGLMHGRLSGNRDNYSFRSMYVEPECVFEYYPWSMYSKDKKFYLLGGFGITLSHVNFNDKNNPDEMDKYRSLQVYMPTIPLGLGYKYNLNENWVLGAEFGCRFAIMDSMKNNMDGFPFRRKNELIKGGESKFLDGFYTFGITIGYTWNY
jgi:hypothetical protein